MTVMDMTPEALFRAVEPARISRQIKGVRVTRCPVRGCHIVGLYEIRGGLVTIATPLKLSPGKAAEFGLESRRIPGRAWLGEAPPGTIVGCDHRIDRI